jgi:uncharacterized protein involved in cysteine biosynthesis
MKNVVFNVNQLGIVRDMDQQLQDWVTHRRQELANSWNRWSSIWNWASWLLPLSGPLFMLLLALLFALVFSMPSLTSLAHEWK